MAEAFAYDWTLGDRLRKARVAAKMQQGEMALLLGTSRPQVSKWERNLAEPRVSELIRWAEVTETPATWLLGYGKSEGFFLLVPPTSQNEQMVLPILEFAA